MDLKAQLKAMIELQVIDEQIYRMSAQKDAAPAQLQALDEAFQEKKQRMTALEKQSLDVQKARKDKELELASREESRKKLQGQLFSLKTNKEYQVMLQQIADSQADASVIEDKILQLFDQVDKIKQEMDQEKVSLQKEEKACAEQKKRIEDDVKQIDGRLAQLETQRKQILPAIAPKILAQYTRILNNRDGMAIVSVKNNSCLGCNMSVPPQVINLIKMYDRLITCEVCNRILYVEEESS